MASVRNVKVGDVIDGKYKLERLIGEGGMGQVYRSTHLVLGRAVAVKVMPLEHTEDARLVQRFLQEAHAAAKVRHKHIVEVLDAGTRTDGSPYIVQELLEGDTLDKLIERRGGRLEPAEALAVLLPIVDAVASLHEAAILHRDIKPENVFLAKVGGETVPKLLDFGISRELESGIRLTTTGTAMGTPAYMSPEQVNGRKVLDARSDIWSLGIVLYELVAGRLPFDGETAAAMFGAIANTEPVPLEFVAPSTPSSIVAIVGRCLQRSIGARYPSARDLAAALRSAYERIAKKGAPAALAAETIIDEAPRNSDLTFDYPVPPPPKTSRDRPPLVGPALTPEVSAYDVTASMLLGHELPGLRGAKVQAGASGLELNDISQAAAPRRAPPKRRSSEAITDAFRTWYVAAAVLIAVTAVATAALVRSWSWAEAPATLLALTRHAMDTETFVPRVFSGAAFAAFAIFTVASVGVWPRAMGRTLGYGGGMLVSAVWVGIPLTSVITSRNGASDLVEWGTTALCIGTAIEIIWRAVEWWSNGRMRIYPVLLAVLAAFGFWLPLQLSGRSLAAPTTTVVPTIDLTQSHTPHAR